MAPDGDNLFLGDDPGTLEALAQRSDADDVRSDAWDIVDDLAAALHNAAKHGRRIKVVYSLTDSDAEPLKAGDLKARVFAALLGYCKDTKGYTTIVGRREKECKTSAGGGDGDTRLGSGDGDTRLGSGDGDTRLGSGDGDTRLGSGDGDTRLLGDSGDGGAGDRSEAGSVAAKPTEKVYAVLVVWGDLATSPQEKYESKNQTWQAQQPAKYPAWLSTALEPAAA